MASIGSDSAAVGMAGNGFSYPLTVTNFLFDMVISQTEYDTTSWLLILKQRDTCGIIQDNNTDLQLIHVITINPEMHASYLAQGWAVWPEIVLFVSVSFDINIYYNIHLMGKEMHSACLLGLKNECKHN